MLVIVLAFGLFQKFSFFGVEVIKRCDALWADRFGALEFFKEVWLVNVDGATESLQFHHGFGLPVGVLRAYMRDFIDIIIRYIA